MKLIGVSGAREVGKDTFYHILQGRGHHVRRIAFADAIRADLSSVQGLSGGAKNLIRPLYQIYGELAKELQGREYWIDRLTAFMAHIPDSNQTFILTDVRFPFEAQWVKDQGGMVVVVERPQQGEDPHPAENSWREIECDYRIQNTGTISDYAQQVLKVWNDHCGKDQCPWGGCGLSEATKDGCTRRDCELK